MKLAMHELTKHKVAVKILDRQKIKRCVVKTSLWLSREADMYVDLMDVGRQSLLVCIQVV